MGEKGHFFTGLGRIICLIDAGRTICLKIFFNSIYNNKSTSIRTLSRITGISNTIIEDTVKKDK